MTRIFYRIHTEHRDNLEELAGYFFPCFAIVKGRGSWKGQTEDSACIEIIAGAADEANVARLAQAIKDENHQEAVYVTATPVELRVI